jgi:hypothetical protein
MRQDTGDGGQAGSESRTFDSGYQKWEQVSGYFDGDGSIKINVNKFTIQIFLLWTDTDFEQLQHIAEFLFRRRIVPVGPYVMRRQGKANHGYNLILSVEGGALVALKDMLPFVYKKRGQVEASIDYLEDKMTGDEFIKRINREVERKKRRAPRRPFLSGDRHMPFTKSQGLQQRSALAAAQLRAKHGLNFSQQELDEIRNATFIDKTPIRQVAKQYGVSWSSIWRYATGKRGRRE